MSNPETKTAKAAAPAAFTREQLAASKRYAQRRDLVTALLEPGKRYTLAEVDGLIEKFMKGKVN